MIDLITLTFFPLLMAYSALSDLFTMTIANRISAALVIGFVALALIVGMPVSTVLINHLACGAGVLCLTFTLFAFGWIGGGDAKLAAATAVWLGWTQLSDYGLLASLLGAGLTLAILRLRKFDLPRFARDKVWIVRLHERANGVPYGIALAVAGLVLYPDSSIWHSVVSL